MYLTRTPKAVQALFPRSVWNVPVDGKELFLTFDDGPTPEVTPWVLDTLAAYDAKATFFCVGSKCQAHPELMDRIRREGHSVGNHTYDHLKGRKTSLGAYLHNVERCQEFTSSGLFRPPYASLTFAQYRALRTRYDVVLWDVLSGDFDKRIDGARCLKNVLAAAREGSIVLFHDSSGAEERVRYALPRVLDHFSERGFRFRALKEGNLH